MKSIDELVLQITQGNAEVLGALVVDSNGTVLASNGVGVQMTTAAVAMVVPMRDFLERAVAELGCGALTASLIEGSSASLAVADVDGERTAIVVAKAGCSPGSLRADSLWLATAVRNQLESQ
jgi:predicted regulator of Ras-like GTPase activity (Roadblock/LC7/MglB family)